MDYPVRRFGRIPSDEGTRTTFDLSLDSASVSYVVEIFCELRVETLWKIGMGTKRGGPKADEMDRNSPYRPLLGTEEARSRGLRPLLATLGTLILDLSRISKQFRRRSSKKFNNHSEPGRGEGSFGAPAFLRLKPWHVFLSEFRRMTLLSPAASDTPSYAVGLRPN